MKKLVIAAAIVCAAAFAQAASVSWTCTAVKGGDGNKITTDMAYTFIVAIYDATTSTKLGESSSSTITFNAVSGTVADAENSHNYYAVLSASNKDYALADSIANTKFYFSTDAMSTYKINLTTGSGLTDETTGIGTWSASSWQSQSVPEPTSGLLLLLGVAGLALKRKQK